MIRQNPAAEVATDDAPQAKSVTELAAELGIADRLPEIHRVAQELFPGAVSVEVGKYPESPEDQYLVFIVQFSASTDAEIAESINRQWQWHEQVTPFIPHRPDALRIVVDYR